MGSEMCIRDRNYTAYSQKKAMLREAAYHAWVNQQQEIHHQEEVIAKLKSFKREKSIKRAESREKMLDKMDVLEKPTEVRYDMRIRLEPRITSGNDVLKVEGLAKSFGSLSLFSDLNFEIKRGEKVAIIGDNGTGKTTLLKILNGVCEPDAGSFSLGSKVHIGYYDQEHHVLHMEKTLFEEISDAYPALTNTQIRNVLASFLFTGDDVFKRISDQSEVAVGEILDVEGLRAVVGRCCGLCSRCSFCGRCFILMRIVAPIKELGSNSREQCVGEYILILLLPLFHLCLYLI